MATDILSKATGQQFVADNRGGAGGNIGAELCARAPADGYTLCMITAAQGVSPAIYRKMSYDPVKDLAPITLMASLPSLLTVASRAAREKRQGTAGHRENKTRFPQLRSTGNGSSPHMLMEMFKFMTGTKMVHVPYKGQAPAVVDQISGQVQLAFNTAISVLRRSKPAGCARLPYPRCNAFRRCPICRPSMKAASKVSTAARGKGSARRQARRRRSCAESIPSWSPN